MNKSNKLFARLKPHNPKGGQPHKSVTLAPLNGLKFIAGKFNRLHPAIALDAKEYLEDQFLDDDPAKPCLYQVVNEEEMRKILRREKAVKERERRALAMGLSLDEMRRLEREEKQFMKGFDEVDLGRSERLRNRPKTALEKMADKLKGDTRGESKIAKIARQEQEEKDALELAREEARQKANEAPQEDVESFQEDDLWNEMEGELQEDPEQLAIEEDDEIEFVSSEPETQEEPPPKKPQTRKEVDDLLSGDAPQNTRRGG